MSKRPSDGRDKDAVAQRLILTRQALGLGQKEFADRARIASNTYNQYESGVNLPSLEKALALKDAYQISLDWIYDGDNSGLRHELAVAIKALRAARI